MRPSLDDRAPRKPVRVSLIVARSAGRDVVGPYQAVLETRPEIESVEVIFGLGELGCEPAATGDYCVALDPDRGYAPEAVLAVLAPLFQGRADVAVAVDGRRGPIGSPLVWPRFVLGLASRLILGTADLFSGLFAVDRARWEAALERAPRTDMDDLLGVVLRAQAREIDVPVATARRFQAQGLDLGDLRPLKRLLDGRHGNLSRLVQFCVVGASGMVVDLSIYALLQFVFSFTDLAARKSSLFGVTWHLVIASAISITTALVWNFSLNRRLTFNDARGGPIVRQFLTYALSNALAIALSFTVRLYLPSRVAFFARHRLAAAVVGIVGATGISFSMSRWIVFSRKTERHQPRPHELAPVETSSAVV